MQLRKSLILMIAVQGTLMACKTRDETSRVLADTGPAGTSNRVRIDDLIQGLTLGKGWNTETGTSVGQVCVEPVPGAAPNAPAAAAPIQGAGLHLQEESSPGTTADVAVEVFDLDNPSQVVTEDKMYQENAFVSYQKLVKAIDKAEQAATAPSAGLSLADTTPATPPAPTGPGAPAPGPTRSDASSASSACADPIINAWVDALPPLSNDSKRAGEFRSFMVQSVKQLSGAMGIKGNVNATLVKGIGLEGDASLKGSMSFDSEAVTLFVDMFNLVKTEPFGGGKSIRLNASAPKSDVAKFRDACGDNYVSAISYGSRYMTTFSMSMKSAESKFEGSAGGKLSGIRLGPAKIGAEGRIDASFASKSFDFSASEQTFYQFGGNPPQKLPESAACKLKFALALPRATSDTNGVPIAFATSKYPPDLGPLGAVGQDAEKTAGRYLTLLEGVANLAGQVRSIYTNLVQYSIDTPDLVEKITLTRIEGSPKKTYSQVYRDLVGTLAITANPPGEVFRSSPSEIGGLFRDVMSSAITDVQRIEKAKDQNEVKTFIQQAEATLTALETRFGAAVNAVGELPVQFGGTLLAMRKGEQAAKQKWPEANTACSSLGQDADLKDLNTFLKKNLTAGVWRLPTKVEVQNMRFGALGFLNVGDIEDQGAVNAYERQAGVLKVNRLQVLTGENRTTAATETSEAYTICVFGLRI